MRLYISGPMSRLPDNNFPAFNRAEILLNEAGYETENPAAKGEIPGWTWDDYLRYDIKKLMECDGIANLELPLGWISEGRELENNIGRALPSMKGKILSVDAWLKLASVQFAAV